MVSTRSQHNKVVQAKAVMTRPQDTLFISNLQDLIAFVEMADLMPEYGVVVTHLRITMSVSALERDFFQKILAACLTLTPSLNVLALVTTPSLSIESLDNVALPSVEVLKTNIPHRAICYFVTTHPSLHTLDISSCGRALKCPLGYYNLDHVTDIRAPIKCTRAIVHGCASRLRLDSDCDGSNITVSNVIPQIAVPPLQSRLSRDADECGESPSDPRRRGTLGAVLPNSQLARQ
ncbi:hypothetical protein C8Q80DRAFT_1275549 [Daedaleopsis nitida]|nr:hypothetical protein C8Q80DRAFT_1275549 [Daedaleopsis nitida]